ncbi:hypothetical protein PGTUg99_011182 [Puccinia graminis f. sp. tritici]|uniref:Uncharacterized protein n=1 Tax=Puccinia graminis f. sp. tritici TaxID=56615 RepID=A0A5B0MQZ2_PUCGR|nr:hypothetical protein PGTUg99_011182 [Puccinia graminis f. sp. tritici]
MIDPTLFEISLPAQPSDGPDDQLPPLPPPLLLLPEDKASKNRCPTANTAEITPNPSKPLTTAPKSLETIPKASATMTKTPAMNSKVPAINSKSLQYSAASNGNTPHTWTTLARQKGLYRLQPPAITSPGDMAPGSTTQPPIHLSAISTNTPPSASANTVNPKRLDRWLV